MVKCFQCGGRSIPSTKVSYEGPLDIRWNVSLQSAEVSMVEIHVTASNSPGLFTDFVEVHSGELSAKIKV
jgi:hypothetical protein